VYVPGVVNVNWYVSPGFMFPESKTPVSEVTVCAAESPLDQNTVLFLPITTVILSRAKR